MTSPPLTGTFDLFLSRIQSGADPKKLSIRPGRRFCAVAATNVLSVSVRVGIATAGVLLYVARADSPPLPPHRREERVEAVAAVFGLDLFHDALVALVPVLRGLLRGAAGEGRAGAQRGHRRLFRRLLLLAKVRQLGLE